MFILASVVVRYLFVVSSPTGDYIICLCSSSSVTSHQQNRTRLSGLSALGTLAGQELVELIVVKEHIDIDRLKDQLSAAEVDVAVCVEAEVDIDVFRH